METKIEKKKSNVKPAPPQPFAVSHYSSHFFAGTLPCDACGKAAGDETAAPFDDYDRTLNEEAMRLTHHASSAIHAGHTEDATGMLRDAARLLDLLKQRRHAREEAEEARRKPRGKAARQ